MHPVTPDHAIDVLVILDNDGFGGFSTVVGGTVGLSSVHPGNMGIGDFDNDGDVDVFTGYSSASENEFFENLGGGMFQQVTLASVGLDGISGGTRINGITWADFDNNGHVDLYIVRNESTGNFPNELFLNNGDRTFVDASAAPNVAGATTGRGDAAGVADYDNDGFLDMLIANGFQQTPGPYQLLRNDGSANRWLRVRPVNPSGGVKLGSRIYIQTSAGMQYREFVDQSGLRGTDELVAHFGLGTASSVSSLRVEWLNGEVTQLTDVAVNQEIILVGPAPPGANQIPQVDAGNDATIQLPTNFVDLDGTVTDDGLPDGTLTTEWSVFSAPPSSSVQFGAVTSVDTSATFSAAGTYVLQLRADDSQLINTDTVTITVLSAPDTGGAAGPADRTSRRCNRNGMCPGTGYGKRQCRDCISQLRYRFDHARNGYLATLRNPLGHDCVHRRTVRCHGDRNGQFGEQCLFIGQHRRRQLNPEQTLHRRSRPVTTRR